MTKVIGVRFRTAGKIYFFAPGKYDIKRGDNVIVETARGVEFGRVVSDPKEVEDEEVVQPLKSVIRLATDQDRKTVEKNKQKEKEAFKICLEKIRKHELEMKLIDVEYTFDNSKIIFYFTANGRVDFRELVKDLASVFKMRIELRQIGVRDEAKMLGGLGSCGRPICCGAFLGDFQPVSIKMAKEQNLSLNPTKISGQCGRLMCCLKYEQAYYESALKKLPKVGREVITPDGSGIITEINVIREKVRVRMQLPDGTFDVREYRLEEVSKPNSASPARPAQEPSDSDEKDLESFDGGEPDGPAEQMDENPAPEPRPRKRPNRDKPKGESGRRERPPRPERIQKETAERLSEPEPAFEIVPANSESPAESGYESPDKLFVPEDDPTE